MTAQIEQLIRILSEGGVEYVLLGGVAALAHGSAMVTFDVDVCYRRDRQNVARLCGALRPFHPALRGAPADLPFVLDPPTVLTGLNFTLATDIGEIDLLGEVAGLGEYFEVEAQSVVAELYGLRVRVLSLEGLIRSKKAAGRPKDLTHLVELEALQEMQQNRKSASSDGL